MSRSELCLNCNYEDCMLSDGQSVFCEVVCRIHEIFKCPECFVSAVAEALKKKQSKKPYPHAGLYPAGSGMVIIKSGNQAENQGVQNENDSRGSSNENQGVS